MYGTVTAEDFEKVEAEYKQALKNFRPVFGDTGHIALAKRLTRIGMDEALLLKHKGKKMESTYRKKVYDGRKSVISSLNYYFKPQEN